MTTAEALLAAAGVLIKTLDDETQALRRLDLKAVGMLTEAKAQQATTYAEHARTFTASRAFERIAPETRDLLKTTIGRMEIAAARNATALSAAGTAHRRLLDTIARAAERRSGKAVVGYGRNGRISAPPRTAPSGPSLLGAQVV